MGHGQNSNGVMGIGLLSNERALVAGDVEKVNYQFWILDTSKGDPKVDVYVDFIYIMYVAL